MELKKVIATLSVVVGLALLGLAAVLAGDRLQLLISGSTVPGTVSAVNIDLGPDRGCSASACHRPQVQFTGANGQRLSFVSKFGSADPQYAPGDRVGVLYVSGASSLAEINDPMRLWVSPGVTVGLGLVLILIGFVYGRRRQPRPAGAPVRLRSDSWLKQHGYPMQAAVQSIARTMQRGSSPRPAWQIVTKANAPRGTKILTYRTEPLDFDPSGVIGVGETMTVLVDPDNPTDYWIDISILRKQFNELA